MHQLFLCLVTILHCVQNVLLRIRQCTNKEQNEQHRSLTVLSWNGNRHKSVIRIPSVRVVLQCNIEYVPLPIHQWCTECSCKLCALCSVRGTIKGTWCCIPRWTLNIIHCVFSNRRSRNVSPSVMLFRISFIVSRISLAVPGTDCAIAPDVASRALSSVRANANAICARDWFASSRVNPSSSL